MNLKQLCKNGSKLISKKSPVILTGMAVGGLVLSIASAIKARPKADEIIKKEKEKLGRDLTRVEKIKKTAKIWVPTFLTATATAACMISSTTISSKRVAAMATAYELAKGAAQTFEDHVLEEVGEKKLSEIKNKINSDKISNKPPIKEEIIETGHGDTLCYDKWAGRYFKSDPAYIREQVNELNATYLADESVCLNDFYYLLGLPNCRMGDVMGWDMQVTGKGDTIKFDYDGELYYDKTPIFVIDYTPDAIGCLYQ